MCSNKYCCLLKNIYIKENVNDILGVIFIKYGNECDVVIFIK